jgi:4-hydroxy-3-polyprenylbenzoate decarboxylase
VIKLGDEAKLSDLPVLTTWEEDGGPFITMGQVYTQSLDGEMNNLGMYRLQVYDDGRLGMHWQIHKDGNHFFHQYKKAGKKMPVSVAIGGDPLYIWCGQAPMPYGMFELLLYGFIRKEPARLVKSITNDIYIPRDVDFVIEGFVDPSKMEIEGPFGDHTGYYTLKEEYPVMDVTAITSKRKPIFAATVVGKPPLEDKYMGHGTGRIFLPLFKTTAPDVLDYHMPENGVFHNLILAKLEPKYPDHSTQLMHAFWGVGQMSFVKHALFVGEDAPALDDWEVISRYILNRVTPEKVLITRGVVDALDHSSPQFAKGGKLGVDATGEELSEVGCELIDDETLLKKVQAIEPDVTELRTAMRDTMNPITIMKINKNKPVLDIFKELKPLYHHLKIAVIVDHDKNEIDNDYMLIWRVTNNIDAVRDVVIGDDTILIDGTNKSTIDGYTREWPGDVECTPSVLESLNERGIIQIDEAFKNRFML